MAHFFGNTVQCFYEEKWTVRNIVSLDWVLIRLSLNARSVINWKRNFKENIINKKIITCYKT